jgi:hypothetical protein
MTRIKSLFFVWVYPLRSFRQLTTKSTPSSHIRILNSRLQRVICEPPNVTVKDPNPSLTLGTINLVFHLGPLHLFHGGGCHLSVVRAGNHAFPGPQPSGKSDEAPSWPTYQALEEWQVNRAYRRGVLASDATIPPPTPVGRRRTDWVKTPLSASTVR